MSSVWPWLVLWCSWPLTAKGPLWSRILVLLRGHHLCPNRWHDWWTLSTWRFLCFRSESSLSLNSNSWKVILSLPSLLSYFSTYSKVICELYNWRVLRSRALPSGNLQQCVWSSEQLRVFRLWRWVLLLFCGWRGSHGGLLGRVLLYRGC